MRVNFFKNLKKIDYMQPGWSTVCYIYSVENLKKSIRIPLWLSIIVLIISLVYSDNSSICYIGYVSDIILMVVPSILGFTLSGYALMMGLSNSEFIKGLARYKENGKNYSMFQSLNATFAVVLFISFVTTIVGICANLILKINIIVAIPNIICQIYNWFCYFVLVFLLFYAINSIKDIVINIFNFGQYVQVYINSESGDDDN